MYEKSLAKTAFSNGSQVRSHTFCVHITLFGRQDVFDIYFVLNVCHSLSYFIICMTKLPRRFATRTICETLKTRVKLNLSFTRPMRLPLLIVQQYNKVKSERLVFATNCKNNL